jgi:hypothetical protein
MEVLHGRRRHAMEKSIAQKRSDHRRSVSSIAERLRQTRVNHRQATLQQRQEEDRIVRALDYFKHWMGTNATQNRSPSRDD